MPLSLKIRSAITLITVFISVVVGSAHAEAPHVEEPKEVLHEAFYDPKAYAYRIVLDKGWNETEFRCLEKLWQKESNWRHKADNPTSTAYGIAQILGETETHPARQIEKGIRYIIHRYDTPCNAWKFWLRNFWY
jgi:hypothetical protein